jgi:hypothetical protein
MALARSQAGTGGALCVYGSAVGSPRGILDHLGESVTQSSV